MKRSKLILIVFLGCVPMLASSQTPFFKLINYEFPSVKFSAVYPTDSCFFIFGDFVDTMTPVRFGLMFTKLNQYGEVQLTKTLKHPDKLFAGSFGDLIKVNDGNFIKVALVGDTIRRAILIKYNHQGDTLLTREYYNIYFPAWDYLVPREIRQKPDGGYAILFGHQSNPFDFDVSLLLLDSSYNIQHYKSYGTLKQETAVSLALDDDGGFLIGTGRTNSNTVQTGYIHRTCIIKTDSTGEKVWEYLSPENELQGEANAIIKTEDGGMVIASATGYEIVINPEANGLEWSGLFFKLDSNQNVAWNTPMRGFVNMALMEFNEMVEVSNGSGYVAVGCVPDSTSGPEPVVGSWIVKVSPSGDSLWARYYSYLDDLYINPHVYDLKETPDGGFVYVGTSPLPGDNPGFIIKLDSFGCLVPGCEQVIIDVDEETGKPWASLSIYPNPATDYLSIYINSPLPAKDGMFRIVNLAGEVMKEFQAVQAGGTFVLPLTDWASGVYFLQYLERNAIRYAEKFVKL